MNKFFRFRYFNADVGTAGGTDTAAAEGTAAAEVAAPVTTLMTETSAAAADGNAAAENANENLTPEQLAEKAADDAASKPQERVVPEKYEIQPKDGQSLDPEVLGEFESIAKELKLTQSEAQKMADLGPKITAKWQAQQQAAIQEAAADWAASATADKEYGGDKFTASLATARKALDAFGTPELKTLLNDSRLGNHPELIRLLVRAGNAISEDRMVTGGAGPASNGGPQSLYAKSKMNP